MKADWSKENLERICNVALSMSEALEMLGLNHSGGGNVGTFKKKVKEYGIDTSRFTGGNWIHNPRKIEAKKRMYANGFGKCKYDIKDILVENSPLLHSAFRERFRRLNMIPYQCSICGNIGMWQNHKMSLELDHINGNNSDNRLENLRWLCPNCHSITDTYCGKNIERWKS